MSAAALAATLDQFETSTRAHGGVDWGRFDCLRLALATRPDLIALFPRYRTPLGARRALAGFGFRTLAEALDSVGRAITPAAGLPGDPALIDGPDGPAAGIVCAPCAAAFIAPVGGLVRHRPAFVWRLDPCRTPPSPLSRKPSSPSA